MESPAVSIYIYCIYIYILYIYIYIIHIYIYIYISVVDKKEGTWIRKVYGLSMFLNLIYSMCIYIYNLMMLRYAKQSHVWSDFDPSGPFREIPSADDPQR